MTAQISEKIILNGVENELHSTPFISDHHSQIETKESSEVSSACWRGYVGTWEIKEEKLYLKQVSGKYVIKGTMLIFADWFTGSLTIPISGSGQYIHAGFGFLYKSNQIITVVKGSVVKIEFRNEDFECYISERIKQLTNRMIAVLLSDSVDQFIYDHPNSVDKKLIVFRYDKLQCLEINLGKALLAIQNDRLPIEMTTAITSRYDVDEDKKYSLLILISTHWAQELSEVFGFHEISNAFIYKNTCSGVWRFDTNQSLVDKQDFDDDCFDQECSF